MSTEGYKRFKDPVYGYVHVPDSFVSGIIDTPAFQRLRRISQTSYAPLFPSATHNRFVHSLGVFHLGTLAVRAVEKSLHDLNVDDIEYQACKSYLGIFRLACLLHDVGHAPFSHTGEEFYKDKDGSLRALHQRLAECVGMNSFAEFCKKNDNVAAPHEVMSAIIGISTFPRFFGEFETVESAERREFFARAITGYCYKHVDSKGFTSDGVRLEFLNCLVKLLNSSIIDVDRLDYLIRDAFQTGYKTLSIDHERLLEGVSIQPVGGIWDVVYTKQAVSVLENVVYAHDAERKWVQSHPSIVYEMDLLKHVIRKIDTQFAQENGSLFCEPSLTSAGMPLQNIGDGRLSVRYLSDDDIVFLMKNISDPQVDQYLDRGKRFRPLWKSEVEYNALFGKVSWGYVQRDDLATFVRHLASLLAKTSFPRINAETEHVFISECEGFQEKVLKAENRELRELFQASLEVAQMNADFAKQLAQFSKKYNIRFDFVFHTAQSFASGFRKAALRDLPIRLDVTTEPIRFGQLTNLLNQDHDDDIAMPFYVFCERMPDTISRLGAARDFCDMIQKFVTDNHPVIQKVARKTAR